ncbi:helix-turn-helix transcriptional regulator, partial [Escherichia coli]|uniref:helix-turn-helix transcriptional regulator n=1 Tax=Escherichia coli TaxID=562 RepID=UPI002113CC0F
FCGACGNNRTNRGGFQFAAARLPWFYMSESQLKKKLKEEGCSFTGVLLDVRMGYARRLLQARLPVNRVAAQCGYVSTSYFICVFRECFGVTPHRMLALQEHGQHKSEC